MFPRSEEVRQKNAGFSSLATRASAIPATLSQEGASNT